MKLYNAGIVLGILFGLACIAFGIWGPDACFLPSTPSTNNTNIAPYNTIQNGARVVLH